MLAGALLSPRYILEATSDGALRHKVGALAKALRDYRDSHGEVMGADEAATVRGRHRGEGGAGA